jgi:hypothetical protein
MGFRVDRADLIKLSVAGIAEELKQALRRPKERRLAARARRPETVRGTLRAWFKTEPALIAARLDERAAAHH